MSRQRNAARRLAICIAAVCSAVALGGFLSVSAGAQHRAAKGFAPPATTSGTYAVRQAPEEQPDPPAEESWAPIREECPALPPKQPEELPADGTEDWMLILVNPWNPLPDGYTVTRTQLEGNQSVDERCSTDLLAMMDACQAAGLSPVICSSYRTRELQQILFDNKVQSMIDQGYAQDEEEARVYAARAVAVPGTSEHQLGLAVDIVDAAYRRLDHTQEQTAVQQWLMAHSWEYGFILRYPSGKSSITGIIYEPWHYRYVGREAAREIYEQDVTLEEYLEQRQQPCDPE